MQFKHPEILYVLFALLIPIIIHLFQLQRFTKTSFTNIKFLKEIEFQTRKSSQLKKWLVLLTRLGTFAALILAFAQPFSSNKDTSKDWLTTIYVDNSLSMQTKGARGELLQRAVHDIAEHLPDKGQFSLLTNEQVFSSLSKESLVEQLKNITYSPTKSDLKTVLLQTQQTFEKNPDKNRKLIVLSDFQTNPNPAKTAHNLESLNSSNYELDFVQLKPKSTFNIAIDSVFVLEKNTDTVLLQIVLKNEGDSEKNISVRALQNEIVLAKNTLVVPANRTQKTQLLIPEKIDNISIQIDSDDAYLFDNTYYISFQQQQLINVLEIGTSNSFLQRIYSSDEFNFLRKSPNEVSFELIEKQELILINNLEKMPQLLGEKLFDFISKGGSLVIIPHKNSTINDVNSFFNQLKIGQLTTKKTDSLLVTKIHFSHPILKNVFDKNISNFQYPSVTMHFQGINSNARNILSFENQEAFISEISKGKGSIYWVSAPLDLKSSNFSNAPLIVPVFYNMGKMSVTQTNLSYRIGTLHEIKVDARLNQDEVLHIEGKNGDFIPMQEIQSEKVILYTEKQPKESGFYKVLNQDIPIKNLGYNYPIGENNLSFLAMPSISNKNKNIHQYQTVKKAMESLTIEQSIQSYFKWFLLLALLLILIEILLLKYL